MPSVVQFANGASTIVPRPTDYDYTDQVLVSAAAQPAEQHGWYVSHHYAGQRRIR